MASLSDFFGSGGDDQVINKWNFADAAERLAFSAAEEADLGKVGWQRDDNTFWALTGVDPITWSAIGINTSAADKDLIPDLDNTRSLGSASKAWKDMFVGPGSLYVNNQKVVEDNSGTIVVSADDDQNVQIQSKGTGDIELLPNGSGQIQMKGNFSIMAGKNVMSSDGNSINFSDGINMAGNKLSGLQAPTDDTDAATKAFSQNADNLSAGTVNSERLPITISASPASGGSDGDIWMIY
jgi:hypothetical protein